MRLDKLILSILTISLIFLLPSPGLSQTIMLPPKYIAFIQQRINSNIIYPAEAEDKGWKGIVKVKFTLMPDGQIKAIDIAKSSGYPLFDEAAMLAVEKASPYPSLEYYLGDRGIQVILPVNYGGIEEPAPAAEKLIQAPPEGQPKEELIKVGGIEEPAQIPPEGLAEGELKEFIGLAIKNNQPLEVARQEIELAQFKVIETRRNLFPALKIAGYVAEGDVYNVDYEEWESKVELSQPLFYGGRLIDEVKQAGVNLEITKKNYDRLKFELIQKTETAYYNLVVAKMHLIKKETLLQEAKEMLEKIERLSEADMIIPLEARSARAWFEQIQFQIDSIKQEVLMAELALEQVLNIKGVPQVQSPKSLEAEKLDIELSTCKQMALQYHPEIRLSELLVKFNEYSQKIKRTEVDAFTVDLVSSYGYYEGHYKVLPWDNADKWFVGIRVSKPWGGSTINTSYDTEETVARFGQSSPSSYSGFSAELNILDNLKRLSDKKRADIDAYHSLSNFNETVKNITFEVQEAFLNYQRALLELNTAQTQMKFRRNETDVIKVRAMVGETNLSNAIESLYSLSEAQLKYIRALANYQISLVNLKKATGYAIQI